MSVKKFIGIAIAVVTLVAAIVELATALIQKANYDKTAEQYVSSTDEVAQRVVKEFNERPDLPNVARPIIVARPRGSDLQIEAGYDLNLSASSTQMPEGGGSLDATITDYGPGKYKLANAPNAQVTINVLKQSIEEFLGKKIQGFSIRTEVLGGADGIPVREGSVYLGDLGPIVNVPFYSYDTQSWKQMTLLKGTSRNTNESIAFLRALDVCRSISEVGSLYSSEMMISTSTTSQVGGQYRKVIVRITVSDALKNEYNDLNPLAKYMVDRSKQAGSSSFEGTQ